MKVGFFFNDFLPRAGGVYTYQQDIFNAFLKLAAETTHEFHIICEHNSREEFGALQERPQNVLISPMAERPWPARTLRQYAARALRRLRKLGKLSATPIQLQREAAVLSAKKIEFTWSIGHYEHEAFDVPYITTVFDLQHRSQPWFPEVSQGGRWQEREDFFTRYVSRATYVATGTEEGRREIEYFYRIPPKRIRVLPLPTPSFSLSPPAVDVSERLHALGISGRFLFYPAQFWPHKNHANLLLALRLLNENEADPFQLALVGSDHGNLEFVRNLAHSLGVSKYVHFLGFVSQEDLVSLYQGAFSLVYPSLFGPDNLPPLEAFALGCPVIMSDYDGAREQLGTGPLYVNATRPEELAEAVRRLAREPEERSRMIERGRTRAQAWTAADYVRGIFAILDEFESIRRCWP